MMEFLLRMMNFALKMMDVAGFINEDEMVRMLLYRWFR